MKVKPKDMVSVASVTTARNARRLLPRHIEGLLLQTRRLQEIIVVDNASTDGTAALLAEEYPEVKVLQMKENLGAAGAWAAGLSYAALNMKHDWIWTFDDDSVPNHDALENLMSGLESIRDEGVEIGIGVAVPVHVGTGISYSPLLWKDAFVHPSADLLAQPVWFADLAFAAGSLVRREVVEEIGLPRADFFMDFFDFEYCLRARSRGYKIAVVNAAQFSHEVGRAREIKLSGYKRLWPDHEPWREYYMSRNLAYAMWWLHPSPQAKWFARRHLVRHAAGLLLFGSQKVKGLLRMAQGFVDGCRGKLGIRFVPDGSL